jgi:D-beta-D-heptose 7-phosphate kinase/D-beta-D-heptose 1-phosphate adenosyltransferase
MIEPAPILSIRDFLPLRPTPGRMVCTSGGFDPIHPGHISCLLESKKHGDTLIVLVNGDAFLRRKKGKAFMDIVSRCRVVAAIRGVDYVIPIDNEEDDTVCAPLRLIHPDVFTKGGDRADASTIPEWAVCQELGIELITGVGEAKMWSSTDFLKEWAAFRKERE